MRISPASIAGVILKESQDDLVVTQIIGAMRDGHEKSGEIAKILEIPVQEVYKASKRLSRKMEQVHKRL